MAFTSSLLSPSARLLSSSWCRSWKLSICRRMIRLSVPVQRCYSSETSNSSAEHPCSGLERYKDLQKYFNRRLQATYRRFSNLPDYSVVLGQNHVYFVEGDSIYRMDDRSEPEQVLDLGQLSDQDEKAHPDKEKRTEIFLWTINRIVLSPNEKFLAATIKVNQRDLIRCVIVDLRMSNFPPLDPLSVVLTLDNVLTFEWATDEVLFYTTLESLRCSRVFRLDLTSSGNKITSVYEETHPGVFVEVALSRDCQVLSINCNSWTSSEVQLIDTTTSHLEPFLVQPRQPDLLYHVEHWRRQLIILANTGPGQEYQVMLAPPFNISMDSWVPLFAPEPGTVIKDMDIVGDHCVLTARTPVGELVLIVVPLNHPKETYTVQLPSWACSIKTKRPSAADQCDMFEIFISSPVCPPVPYCLHPEDGLLLSGTDDGSLTDNYLITRLEACSKDGTSVPVTLLHRKTVQGLRHAPLLAHVYGAYGRDLDMEFSPEKHLLLELGWVLAYCHIRGGGELGLSWHRQARVEGKQRAVEDLEACLLHLFSLGVSSPSLTALTACSAGAVPVGALCNRQPHLVQAVTLQAPFLDVLGTTEDPCLPLTVGDREEWGDPVRNPKHKLTISSYCPLHNITTQCYPSILLTAYRDDPRIPLEGVLKYADRVKNAIKTHFKTKQNLECDPVPNVILNIQPGSNHLGPDDFALKLKEEALKLAFLYTELGLEPPQLSHKRRYQTNRRMT